MIALIGDTHGEIDHYHLDNKKVKKACDGTYPDYAIVLGDFGFIWNAKPNDSERYWLSWMNKKPFITLFLPGNHENYDRLLSNEFPTIEMFGARVKQISKKVYMLQSGEVYDIDGSSFFVMGGAQSHDKEYRKEYISWWRQETNSESIYRRAYENLNKRNWRVDYVLSHTQPQELKVRHNYDWADKTPCPVSVALDHFYLHLDYDLWFCGHLHVDKVLDSKHTILYDAIATIGA